MVRKISRILILILALASYSHLVLASIVDAPVIAEILRQVSTKATSQISKIQEGTNVLSQMNQIMGGGLMSDGDLGAISNLCREFTGSIDKLGYSIGSDLSLLQTFSDNPNQQFSLREANASVFIRDALKEQLYPLSSRPLTFEKLDFFKRNRIKAVESSSLNGMTIADTRKQSLKDTKKLINTLANKAIESTSLHSDLMVTNRLLVLLTTQMNQQQDLMAHQLELISSLAAQSVPIIQVSR